MMVTSFLSSYLALGDVNPSCNLKAVSGQISQPHGYFTPPLYPNLSDMAMRDVKARQELSKPWGMSDTDLRAVQLWSEVCQVLAWP